MLVEQSERIRAGAGEVDVSVLVPRQRGGRVAASVFAAANGLLEPLGAYVYSIGRGGTVHHTVVRETGDSDAVEAARRIATAVATHYQCPVYTGVGGDVLRDPVGFVQAVVDYTKAAGARREVTLVVAALVPALGIGHKGGLPWKMAKEMAFFRRVTSRAAEGKTNAVVMGRKTWESIPPRFRPLSGRHNVVLTRGPLLDGVATAASLPAALQALPGSTDRVYVIGGGEVYRQALASGVATGVLMSEVERVDGSEVPIDTVLDFPGYAGNGWRRCSQEELQAYVGEEAGEWCTEGDYRWRTALFRRV